MRYFYLPPEKDESGEPFTPLEYAYCGSTRVFQNPTCYHRLVEEIYDIGLLIDTRSGQPRIGVDGKQLTLKGKRRKWVLDEERNKKLAEGEISAPRNYMDLKADERQWLSRAVYQDKSQYLKSENEMKAQHESEMSRMTEQNLAEIKALKKELERLKLEAKVEVEVEKRKAEVKKKSGS